MLKLGGVANVDEEHSSTSSSWRRAQRAPLQSVWSADVRFKSTKIQIRIESDTFAIWYDNR